MQMQADPHILQQADHYRFAPHSVEIVRSDKGTVGLGFVKIPPTCGLGFDGLASGPCRILDVAPSSPADKSRCRVGDTILAVDGKSVLNLALQEIKGLFEGKPHSRVKVLLQADPYKHAKAKEVSTHVADDLAHELAYEVASEVASEVMHELDHELNGGGAQGSTRRLMALLSGTGERSLCAKTSGGSMEGKIRKRRDGMETNIDDHQEMTTNIVRQGLSLRPYPTSFTSWVTSILPRSAQRKGLYGLAVPRAAGPPGRTALSSCRGSMQLPLDASAISEKSDDEGQTSSCKDDIPFYFQSQPMVDDAGWQSTCVGLDGVFGPDADQPLGWLLDGIFGPDEPIGSLLHALDAPQDYPSMLINFMISDTLIVGFDEVGFSDDDKATMRLSDWMGLDGALKHAPLKHVDWSLASQELRKRQQQPQHHASREAVLSNALCAATHMKVLLLGPQLTDVGLEGSGVSRVMEDMVMEDMEDERIIFLSNACEAEHMKVMLLGPHLTPIDLENSTVVMEDERIMFLPDTMNECRRALESHWSRSESASSRSSWSRSSLLSAYTDLEQDGREMSMSMGDTEPKVGRERVVEKVLTKQTMSLARRAGLEERMVEKSGVVLSPEEGKEGKALAGLDDDENTALGRLDDLNEGMEESLGKEQSLGVQACRAAVLHRTRTAADAAGIEVWGQPFSVARRGEVIVSVNHAFAVTEHIKERQARMAAERPPQEKCRMGHDKSWACDRAGELVEANVQSTLQSALRRGAGDDAREERGEERDAREERGERDDAPHLQPPNMQSTSAFWEGCRGDRSRTLSACLAAKAGGYRDKPALIQEVRELCKLQELEDDLKYAGFSRRAIASQVKSGAVTAHALVGEQARSAPLQGKGEEELERLGKPLSAEELCGGGQDSKESHRIRRACRAFLQQNGQVPSDIFFLLEKQKYHKEYADVEEEVGKVEHGVGKEEDGVADVVARVVIKRYAMMRRCQIGKRTNDEKMVAKHSSCGWAGIAPAYQQVLGPFMSPSFSGPVDFFAQRSERERERKRKEETERKREAQYETFVQNERAREREILLRGSPCQGAFGVSIDLPALKERRKLLDQVLEQERKSLKATGNGRYSIMTNMEKQLQANKALKEQIGKR